MSENRGDFLTHSVELSIFIWLSKHFTKLCDFECNDCGL